MPDIIFETSGWWLLPIVIVSASLALWLYNKSSSLQAWQRVLLAILRFSAFFLAGLLLLSPLLHQEEEKIEKPFLVWLGDHSLSMISTTDSVNLQEFYTGLPKLSEPLNDRYRLNYQSFSAELLTEEDSFDASGTNIERALLEIQDRYYNRNLAGVVLVSDGIYNEGGDPAYLAEQLPFPVNTVIAGDTTRVTDLVVERVIHNQISYLNNEFPVEIYVRGRALDGQDYRVKVMDPRGQTLIEESHRVNGSDYFRRHSYFLRATEEGFQRYTVLLETSAPEPKENNRSVFSVEVLSVRKQILILGSAPHPDLAALGNALRSAERYEVTSQISSSLPAEKEYDLCILHQPSPALLQKLEQSNTAYWLFLGDNTGTGGYEPLQAGDKGYEESEVYVNDQFDLFTLSADQLELFDDLPPLWAPFGSPVLSGDYFPVMFKRIGSIKTTDPAWLFRYDQRGMTSERRSSILLGTGIWRWRMYCYRQNENFGAFDNLVQKSVQFLTTKTGNRRFDVDIANRYGRTERIMGEARLYNSSLELVNDPEVKIQFISEEGDKYDFSFSRSGNTYRLNAGSLPPGIYSWRATANLGEENFNDAGKLLIEEELKEVTDLVARPEVMRNIADASGGKAYVMAERQQLIEDLLNNPDAKSYRSLEYSTRSLIEKRWPFFVLLLLLALEWGLRKYFGRY